MKIVAVFSDPDAAQEALRRLNHAACEIYSSEPLDFRRVPSRMRWATLAGGLAGAVGGAGLAVLTAKAMGVRTGGLPLYALPPIGIVTFALTGLGAIAGVLVTLIGEAGLLKTRLTLPETVRQEIATGAVVLTVETDEAGRAEVEQLLVEAGGKLASA